MAAHPTMAPTTTVEVLLEGSAADLGASVAPLAEEVLVAEVLVGMVRLAVDLAAAAEGIAGISSAKALVGMMTGTSSVHATRRLCSRSRSLLLSAPPAYQAQTFRVALLWRCW